MNNCATSQIEAENLQSKGCATICWCGFTIVSRYVKNNDIVYIPNVQKFLKVNKCVGYSLYFEKLAFIINGYELLPLGDHESNNKINIDIDFETSYIHSINILPKCWHIKNINETFYFGKFIKQINNKISIVGNKVTKCGDITEYKNFSKIEFELDSVFVDSHTLNSVSKILNLI